MTKIASSDYHDYVIKDGQFIGEFDQMYRNVRDPWHCVAEANSFKNNLLLGAVAHLRDGVRTALDVGCGLGALTARLRDTASGAQWHACDVSPAAIEKAAADVPGVRFFVQDLSRIAEVDLPFDNGSLDLVVMSEVMWYILPQLGDVLAKLHAVLRPGGHLVILQYFLRPEEQRYGREFVSTPDDLLGYMRAAGFSVVQDVYIGAAAPQALLTVARTAPASC